MIGRTNTVFPDEKKVIIHKVKRKKGNNKKKLLLGDGHVLLLLLNCLNHLRLTNIGLDSFFLICLSNLSITMRVKVSIINKKIVGSLGFNGTGCGLAFGINGYVG